MKHLMPGSPLVHGGQAIFPWWHLGLIILGAMQAPAWSALADEVSPLPIANRQALAAEPGMQQPVSEAADSGPGAAADSGGDLQAAPSPQGGGQASPSSPTAAEKPPAPGLEAFPPLAQFQVIAERPLFLPGRRPDAKPDKVGSEQELKETWRLTGVVMVDQQLLALFSERKGEQRLKLMEGMPLDEAWQVEQILPDQVVLQAGELRASLKLREPRDVLPVATPGKNEAALQGGNNNSGAPKSAGDNSPGQKSAAENRSKADTGK